MDFRSMLDQVKQAFVIGKDNPFLHGRKAGQTESQGYEEPAYQPPQQNWAQQNYAQQAPWQPYPQQEAYQQPPAYQQSQAYQQPQAAYAPAQQPWQAPQANYYQPPQQPEPQPQPQASSFQSQFSMDSYQEPQRNRRSQQRQEQPVYQAPAAQPAENLVNFPGHTPAESKMVDAYVINVFNINSCRQAMSCLRKGQCTLIVMDQLIDKAEIRRYVDMLTGACYALGGTMTRLSARIGFYIMAPNGMTVYTDPTTSNANAQPKPAQHPLYRASTVPGTAPDRAPYDFQGQGTYAPPQMQFNPQHQQAYAPQEEQYAAPPQQEAYAPYQEPSQRYAVGG